MNTDNFEAIKAEILKRAKEHHACTEQYGRAYKSENLAELLKVIKDNFQWACHNFVVTPDIIEQYREDFAVSNIYLNVDSCRGFLLCYNASVTAFDDAIVEAYGESTVNAFDNAKITAYGNSKVEAVDNVTVTAYDNVKVKAYGFVWVSAFDNTSITAFCNSKVEAFDNASIMACGTSYCTSLNPIDCKLSENAIYRLLGKNTIFYANDAIKFVKQ